jgi:hypothetical protein
MLTVEFFGRGEDAGIFVAELQESLDTTTRMLWTLSIETMRHRHHKTGSLLPL